MPQVQAKACSALACAYKALEGGVVGAHVKALGQVAPAVFQLGHGVGVGLPVALARGFEHALYVLRQRVRVVGLEPALQARSESPRVYHHSAAS